MIDTTTTTDMIDTTAGSSKGTDRVIKLEIPRRNKSVARRFPSFSKSNVLGGAHCSRIHSMEDLTSLASEVRSFVDGTAAVDKTKSIKQGVLTKQGAVIKNWKKRHCIIAQGALLYYKDGQVSTHFPFVSSLFSPAWLSDPATRMRDQAYSSWIYQQAATWLALVVFGAVI